MMNPPPAGPIGPALSAAPIIPDPSLLQPAAPPPARKYPNFIPSEEEQNAIVAKCNELKRSLENHAGQRKEEMRTCYAYSKSKFVGDDLLPRPSAVGNDKDNNKDRPQVFIPLTRQQIKTTYAQLKLTIFPNDQDWFRVRAKNALGVQFEEQLTEGLKYKFKEAQISEKLGKVLYNCIWAGPFIAFPTIQEKTNYEWALVDSQDPITGELTSEYQQIEQPGPSLPDLEAWNPLNFWIDPTASDYEYAKWMYLENKKGQEFYDSDRYFNQDKLRDMATKEVDDQLSPQTRSTAEFDNLQKNFTDIEDNFKYALYYFPVLEVNGKTYRNVSVGIVNEAVMVRFKPNLFPKGLNPVVYTDYMPEPGNPYSTPITQDLLDIQKTINIIWNWMLEELARNGNRYAVSPDADTSQLFGLSSSIIVTPNPREDVQNISGDTDIINVAQNLIGVLKAEGQIVSGSQNPFQGSSNVDYQKTATELTILQENSISILREVIEHLAVTGVQRVTERLMYLMAELYPEPVEIPITNKMTGQREFIMVDFRMFKSDQFTIEVVSTNPSQSKQAQINGLMQLVELAAANPQALEVNRPVLEKIGELQGLKDVRDLIDQISQRFNGLQQQQLLAAQQAGLGAAQQPPVEGPPPPDAAPGNQAA